MANGNVAEVIYPQSGMYFLIWQITKIKFRLIRIKNVGEVAFWNFQLYIVLC